MKISTLLGDFTYYIFSFFGKLLKRHVLTNIVVILLVFSVKLEEAVTKKESNPRKGQENRVLLRKNPKKEKRDFIL